MGLTWATAMGLKKPKHNSSMAFDYFDILVYYTELCKKSVLYLLYCRIVLVVWGYRFSFTCSL